MSAALAVAAVRSSRVRLGVVTMLFIATTINYADRATLSIAGPALAKDLGLDAVSMGYVFSAFAWSYVLAQLPGGWLLDRYGAKWVYAGAIFLWSLFTLLQGAVGFLTGFAAVAVLFTDLDNFKQVDDRYGHTADDQVLIAVAHQLQLLQRPGDTARHLGGDEFVCCARTTDAARPTVSPSASTPPCPRRSAESAHLAGTATPTGSSRSA